MILTPPGPVGPYVDYSLTTRNPSTTFTVTPASPANTKGTPTQLVAATDYDVGMIGIVGNNATFSNTVRRGILVDIMIGASSSEKVIVPNVYFGGNDAFTTYYFPIFIPRGSRISARSQADTATTPTVVMQHPILWPASDQVKSGMACTTYGADTSTSLGPTITDGNGAWGTPTELASATTAPARWATVSFGIGTTAASAATKYYRLMIGAGGSEKVLVPLIAQVILSANEGFTVRRPMMFWPVNIPIGSRISIAGWGSGTTEVAAILHLIG